jgi:hypothetical protein
VQPYLVSWFRFDPAEVLADLPLPCCWCTAAPTAGAARPRRLLPARTAGRAAAAGDGMDHLLAIDSDAARASQVAARDRRLASSCSAARRPEPRYFSLPITRSGRS